MKKHILTIAVLLAFTTILTAQSKGLPEGIAAAFSGKYDGVAIKHWKFKNGNYIITFKGGAKNHEAVYSDGGSWLRTETSFGLTNNLPEAVKSSWKNCDYKAWIVEAIKQIESNDGNFYVVRVTNSWTTDAEHLPEKLTYDLYFSPNGELIKKVDRPFGSASL